ncbi:MAG: hypothetical protein AB7E79_14510 [Rhodospirillaceae bacterium]
MKNIILAAALIVAGSAPAFSAAAPEGPVGYGGAKIQMMPMMAPYKVGKETRYQVLSLRLVLAPNPETERPACFMVPILHEKILLYLHKAKLTQADFSGQRLDVLREKLLEVAIANSDKSYFTDVEFLDDQSMLPTTTKGKDGQEVKSNTNLDPRSQTLSSQCR